MDRSAPRAAESSRPTEQRSDSKFILIAFPIGHLVNDWPGASLWLLTPAIALSLDLSPAEVGLLIALHSAGASVAYLPSGILGDWIRNRGLLLTGTFWWVAIGYFIASFAPDFWTLALLLALAGLGDAAWHPIAAAAMVELRPARRAQLIGVHAIGGTLAEIGAPLCAGFLLAVFEWQTVLAISVIPAAITAVAFVKLGARVPRSTQPRATSGDLLSLLRIWLRPGSLTLVAIISLYNMSLMGALAMMPLFVQRVHDYSTAAAGMLFAAAYMLGALAQPVFGRISDLVGRKWISLCTFVVSAVLFVYIVNLSDPIGIGIALVLAIGLLVGIRSVLLAAMVDRSGRRESTTLGFAFSIMDGVGALGAWFAGIAAMVELQHAFVFTAAVTVAAAALTARHVFTTIDAGSVGRSES